MKDLYNCTNHIHKCGWEGNKEEATKLVDLGEGKVESELKCPSCNCDVLKLEKEDEKEGDENFFIIYQMERNEHNRFWKFDKLPPKKLELTDTAILRDKELNYKEVFDSSFHQEENEEILEEIFEDYEDNDKEILERIFRVCNCNHPIGYQGHSLSVSDIVQLNGTCYICDSFGWTKLKS